MRARANAACDARHRGVFSFFRARETRALKTIAPPAETLTEKARHLRFKLSSIVLKSPILKYFQTQAGAMSDNFESGLLARERSIA